jgi:hypothetical protein
MISDQKITALNLFIFNFCVTVCIIFRAGIYTRMGYTPERHLQRPVEIFLLSTFHFYVF